MLCSLIYLSYVVIALRTILVLVVYLGGGAHERGIQERPENGAGSFGTVVTDGCELPVWKLGIKFSQVFSKGSKSC